MSTIPSSFCIPICRKRSRPSLWAADEAAFDGGVTSGESSDDEVIQSRADKENFSSLGMEDIDLKVPFKGTRIRSAVRNYAGYSLGGYNATKTLKQNQDALLMAEDAATNSLLIVCMDGHGPRGELVSQFVKNALQEKLFQSELFSTNVEGAIRLALCEIELELFQQSERYADMSGTTLCLVVVRGNKVTVANIGDSRIVLCKPGSPSSSSSSPGSKALSVTTGDDETSDDDIEVTPRYKRRKKCIFVDSLSVDHKPNVREEYERILSSGGRVFSVRFPDGSIGPPRVWLGERNSPGLAMSRSIGDFIIQSVGVISTPDIMEYDLDISGDSSLIIGTDGVWDHISNQEAAEITSEFSGNSHRAVAKLIATARGRWERAENMADDITACIINLTSFH